MNNHDVITLPASYYQQFSADYSLDVPAEAYGGWKQTEIELSPAHTAVVVMHAWDCGGMENYPGWYRCVEYLPRAEAIVETVFPPLLQAVRASRLPLFHVVGGNPEYYNQYPGYRHAVELAGPAEDKVEQVEPDPVLQRLRAFRENNVFVGEENQADVNRGLAVMKFPANAAPQGEEGIAENGAQLLALCKEAGINHLIYCGFAINWCLLLSPGGMAEMSRHGLICSAIRQAVTAVENRESAREEVSKELGLWRVALAYGFVFDVDDFIGAIL